MERLLHRLRKTRLLQQVLTRFKPNIKIKLREIPHPVFIQPLRNTQELYARSYDVEADVVACIEQLLREYNFTHFFDIGANIGFYSWLVLARTSATICHAFEPDPDNVATMRKTAVFVDQSRLKIILKAVSDRQSTQKFLRDSVTGKTGSLVPVYGGKSYSEYFFSQERHILSVETVSLDEYSAQLRPKEKWLIKADIEGGEVLLLAGAHEVLIHNRPIVILEVNRHNVEQVVALMTASNYSYRIISKSKTLDKDYLFFPKELKLNDLA